MLDYLTEGHFPSFNSLESEGFKDLIEVADEKITVKSRFTYSRNIDEKHKNVLTEVCNIISADKSNMESIAFTNDCWTSRSNDPHISLTAHYIDEDFNLNNWTPFVKPFPGSHTGERIKVKLENMIDNFELPEDVDMWSVHDNAANVRLAVSMSDLVEFTCKNHTIQLSVNDAFAECTGMQAAVDSCKSLATLTHKSSMASEAIKKECEELDIDFQTLKPDCPTRWDS